MRASWRSKGPSKQVAWLAACVLVLQTIFVAWTSHAAATPALDAFGNPLCITSPDGHGSGDDKPTLPSCCVLGCATAIQALVEPDSTGEQIVLRVVEHLAPMAVLAIPTIPAEEHAPGSPRAPPARI